MTDEINFSEFGPNSGFVEELYRLFLLDPGLVGGEWAQYFSKLNGEQANGYHHPGTNGRAAAQTESAGVDGRIQESASKLVAAYRRAGHLAARINPLSAGVPSVAVPEALTTDFSKNNDSILVYTSNFAGIEKTTLAELAAELKRTYCGSIGFDFDHLENESERAWLTERIEAARGNFSAQPENAKRRLKLLVDAETLESELHRRYVGQKRFSLEGGESLIAALTAVLDSGARSSLREAVIGMAHRGRLNVLVNIVGKPLRELFREFEDNSAWAAVGSGDVKYHMGFESDYLAENGQAVRVVLAPNPSHLEAVNPVVEGAVRAKQDQKFPENRAAVLPIIVHGDAAFPGQGVVSETFNFSNVPGYSTRGTLHFVVNNQIGFTAEPQESRSSTYCTDIVKGIGVPVFHVNGEDIDAVCWASELALEYRNAFAKDVIVDIYCYRKYGHNEGDDPSFTQPLMYAEIKSKTPPARLYGEKLIKDGIVSAEDFESYYADFKAKFNSEQDAAKSSPIGDACAVHGKVRGRNPATGVGLDELKKIAKTLVEYPEGFVVHPKLQKILEKRVESLVKGEGIDWGFAEVLAFGSLVADGFSVRVSGQDSGRGTFSQRQLELRDYQKPSTYFPLSSIPFGKFEVINSVLSEESVLAFEFGYAASAERSLVCWEAQFGDFANSAQVVIDQFISSSEQKWSQRSGVVMLLPHGFEGQGPEHSSARLERYLQLCADGNMSVCVPSSAGQYFHLLRRQALSEIKRPLIVMTPKSMLRSADASCGVEELGRGEFKPVLHDAIGKNPTAVIFVSGKVFYDVRAEIEKTGLAAHVLRIEELYPFPSKRVKEILASIKPKSAAWVQEEPRNMGGFYHAFQELRSLVSDLAYIGRAPSASTATGSGKHHAKELSQMMTELVDFLRA